MNSGAEPENRICLLVSSRLSSYLEITLAFYLLPVGLAYHLRPQLKLMMVLLVKLYRYGIW